MAQESTAWRPGTILAAASGFAALVLAILYALGAVLISGALRAAHLSVQGTLAVVPSQQFLARGVAVFLSSFGFVVFIVIWLLAALWIARAWERRRREVSTLRGDVEEHRKKLLSLGEDPDAQDLLDQLQELDDRLDRVEPRMSRNTRISLWLQAAAALGFCGYARLVDIPWLLILSLLFTLGALEIIRYVWLPLVTSAVIFIAQLIIAFYYPTSLSPARLIVRTGAPVQGLLISENSGHWFLAKARKVLVIPDAVEHG